MNRSARLIDSGDEMNQVNKDRPYASKQIAEMSGGFYIRAQHSPCTRDVVDGWQSQQLTLLSNLGQTPCMSSQRVIYSRGLRLGVVGPSRSRFAGDQA